MSASSTPRAVRPAGPTGHGFEDHRESCRPPILVRARKYWDACVSERLHNAISVAAPRSKDRDLISLRSGSKSRSDAFAGELGLPDLAANRRVDRNGSSVALALDSSLLPECEERRIDDVLRAPVITVECDSSDGMLRSQITEQFGVSAGERIDGLIGIADCE